MKWGRKRPFPPPLSTHADLRRGKQQRRGTEEESAAWGRGEGVVCGGGEQQQWPEHMLVENM